MSSDQNQEDPKETNPPQGEGDDDKMNNEGGGDPQTSEQEDKKDDGDPIGDESPEKDGENKDEQSNPDPDGDDPKDSEATPINEEDQNLGEEELKKKRVYEWFIGVIQYEISEFTAEMITEAFKNAINSFLYDASSHRFFIWVELRNEKFELMFNDNEMKGGTKEYSNENFLYFVKTSGKKLNLTRENVEDHISYGFVNFGDNMRSLLTEMTTQVLPEFIRDKEWPDNIKKDLLDQSHKFLASLTEVISHREGKTKLYIPQEDFNVKMSSQDRKDMVHRLESILLHWTKQIKDLVNNQVNQNDSDNVGPIEEINEWSYRRDNLVHMDQQLENPKLKAILEILSEANSSYLKSLTDQIKQIKEGAEEAEDNLKYLNTLYKPCKEMISVSPVEIPNILPRILNCVRLIKEYSNNYKDNDKISGLLRKISNEIIKRCRNHINLDDMLGGDVHK